MDGNEKHVRISFVDIVFMDYIQDRKKTPHRTKNSVINIIQFYFYNLVSRTELTSMQGDRFDYVISRSYPGERTLGKKSKNKPMCHRCRLATKPFHYFPFYVTDRRASL